MPRSAEMRSLRCAAARVWECFPRYSAGRVGRDAVLGKLARLLWRSASVVNTANIVLSRDPTRIAKHLVRRRLVKRSGRFWRKMLR